MLIFSQFFTVNTVNIILAITGIFITLLTILTARINIKTRRFEYLLINIVFVISFLIVIFTNNWLIFIVFWEMVTVSTALMLLWKSRGLSGQYLIIQFTGSSLLIFVILLAYNNGYMDIMPIKESWLQNFFVLGLGMKSAVFGLHFWLPAVHSQAPAPVSAILSGWVVKLGFIMYLKLITTGNTFLLLIGLVMIFYGGFMALISTDYKVLLAYSSISQLGFIAIGIGSGTMMGFVGSIFHMIAHSIAKTGLFIGSGYYKRIYASRNINDYKNFNKRPFVVNLSTIIGFLSLMGFPFFFGFNSKYLIKYGFHNNYYMEFLLCAAGIITAMYSFRFLYIINSDFFAKISSYDFKKKRKDFFYNIIKILSGKKTNKDKLSLLDKLDGTVLILTAVLLITLSFFTESLAELIREYGVKINYLNSSIRILFIFIISVYLLRRFNWIKREYERPPLLDMYFNKVNKYLHKTARYLYSIIYHEFQYQLLYIPGFIILLFVFIMFI
ncbi:MAG: complex I subunit 5 family protein [Bacillota bacterium]